MTSKGRGLGPIGYEDVNARSTVEADHAIGCGLDLHLRLRHQGSADN